MSINISQVPAAIQTVGQIEKSVQQLSALLQQAVILNSNGWQVNIAQGTGLPPINVPVDGATQAAMVAEYDTLKANLASLYSTLP